MRLRPLLVCAACLCAAGCSGQRESRLTGVVQAAQIVAVSPVDGLLETVEVQAGYPVEQGALLATIDARPLAARVRQLSRGVAAASSSLAAARERRKKVAAELESMRAASPGVERRVVGGRVVETASETGLLRWDMARDRLMAAEVLEQSARGALAEAKGALEAALAAAPGFQAGDAEAIEVHAPASGVVAARTGPPGKAVRAGEPIATLYDLSDAWVCVALEESFVSSYSEGDSLEVELADGRTLTGTVAAISPAASFAVQRDIDRRRRDIRAFEVQLRLPETAGLRPGMTAYVRVPLR